MDVHPALAHQPRSRVLELPARGAGVRDQMRQIQPQIFAVLHRLGIELDLAPIAALLQARARDELRGAPALPFDSRIAKPLKEAA